MSARSERDRIETILRNARTIAVLGAHAEEQRPAHFVPSYLHQHGYRVVPVNPEFVDRSLWGERVRAKVTDLDGPVDVVDVFRRAEHLPAHLPELLAMEPRPRVVWLQKGIRHDEVADALRDADIEVVQNRCMLIAHKTLGLDEEDGASEGGAPPA